MTIAQAFVYNWNEAGRDLIMSEVLSHESGGIRRFEGLTLNQLQELVEKNFANPEDRQNNSPTIEYLLTLGQLAQKDEHEVLLSGYAVSAIREDYRVSIDAIDIYFNHYDISQELLKKLFSLQDGADEFLFDTDSCYIWWD